MWDYHPSPENYNSQLCEPGGLQSQDVTINAKPSETNRRFELWKALSKECPTTLNLAQLRDLGDRLTRTSRVSEESNLGAPSAPRRT